MKRRLFGDFRSWINSHTGAQDSCASWTHLLSLYADAQATPQQAQRMKAHLEACASCRAALTLLRATTQVASSWSALEMPPGLSDRLSRAIADEARRQRVEELETSRAPRRRFGLPQIALSGVALSAALVGAYVFTHHELTSHSYPPPTVAVHPDHGPIAVPGVGEKTSSPVVVADRIARRHPEMSPTRIVVTALPQETHPILTSPALRRPPVVTHPMLRTGSVQPTRPLVVANAVKTHDNPIAHSRPHASGTTQIAKAVRPSTEQPREPGTVSPAPGATTPAPATIVVAANPVTPSEPPVVRLASTLKSLARSTQHIEPGTDQVSVAMVRTASYTGAVTMVGSSIH